MTQVKVLDCWYLLLLSQGSRRGAPLPLDHPRNWRPVLHPGRAPQPLGCRGHRGGLHQAEPLRRQHLHSQPVCRVSLKPNLSVVTANGGFLHNWFYSSLVWILSAVTLGALYYFNYTDVGIVNAIKMLWKLWRDYLVFHVYDVWSTVHKIVFLE